MQHLLENITQLRTDQTRIAASYENNQSYEMAYIAIWSILEISLKDISPYAKKGTTKWRDKRNRIAHNAEEFHKLDTYQEYKNKLLNGIDELVVSLSAAIQENQ